jgi:hypothetical protein
MPNNTAKFYYRSYIDEDLTGYAFAGAFTNTTNVNDRRKNTYAITSGLGTDGDSADFEADMLTERSFDTIFLKSNLKTFTIYYWDENETGTGGSGYVELTSYASNTSDWLAIDLGQTIYATKLKIVGTHTITASEEKKIHILEITSYINEINIEKIKIEQMFEREDFKNIYGGSVQIVKYPNRGKTQIDLSWGNMSASDYAVYIAIKQQSLIDAVVIYLYYSDDYDLLDDEALYLVNDIEDKLSTPASETMTAGVDGKMKLLEC